MSLSIVCRRQVRCALGLLLVVTASALPADAHHFDNMYGQPWHRASCPQFCRTDNTTLTVYLGALEPRMFWATAFTLNETWDPDTKLTVKVVADKVTSGSAETDIIYEYGSLGGDLGVTSCNDPIGSYRCDQHYVRYDPGEICAKFCTPDNTAAFNHIACHETGHAVGLLHGADAGVANNDPALLCMETPIRGASPKQFAGWHNVDRVNATY